MTQFTAYSGANCLISIFMSEFKPFYSHYMSEFC